MGIRFTHQTTTGCGFGFSSLAGMRTEIKAHTPETITDRQIIGEIVRRVRSDGFALVDEELELGLRSIAVLIRNRQRRTVAAMNIGVHPARVSVGEMIHRLLPILQESAKNLAQLLN